MNLRNMETTIVSSVQGLRLSPNFLMPKYILPNMVQIYNNIFAHIFEEYTLRGLLAEVFRMIAQVSLEGPSVRS